MYHWLLNRLKERSSWLAIFTLAGLFGMKIEPELREHIINAILAVAAVAAFVFREDAIQHDQTELPKIELVARSERTAPKREADEPLDAPITGDGFARYRDTDDDGLHDLPTERQSESRNGWNG